MKFIICENKLNQIIYNYIDEMLDSNDIYSTNPLVYDEETGEEYEDPNRIEFYIGDYEGPNDSDFVFNWYSVKYFSGGDYSGLKRKSPILEIRGNEAQTLTSYFGDNWHEPLKKWFQNNFELPVKTVEIGLSN